MLKGKSGSECAEAVGKISNELGKLARHVNTLEPRARVKLTQQNGMLAEAVLCAVKTYPGVIGCHR